MAKAKNSFVPASKKNSSVLYNENVTIIIIYNNQKTNCLYAYNLQNRYYIYKKKSAK